MVKKDVNYRGRHWAPPKPAWLTRHLTAAGAITVVVALVAVSGVGALMTPQKNAGTPRSIDDADFPPPAVIVETPRYVGPLIPTQAPEPEPQPVILVSNNNSDEIAALEQQIADLTDQLKAAAARAQEAEELLALLQGQVEDLESDTAAFNAIVSGIEDLIASLDARIDALEAAPAPEPTPIPTSTDTGDA